MGAKGFAEAGLGAKGFAEGVEEVAKGLARGAVPGAVAGLTPKRASPSPVEAGLGAGFSLGCVSFSAVVAVG